MPATPNPLNNTVGTATNLLLSAGLPQTVSGLLSATDTVDYYRFTTTAASDLKLVMNGLSGDAQLSVFQTNGTTPLTPGSGAGNTVSTNNAGLLSESFVFNNLAAGSYVIKVERATANTGSAEYLIEALASRDATANSLLWQSTPLTNNSPLAISWLLNGVNLIGQASPSAAQNPDFAGLQYLDSADFDGDTVQDILWKKDLGGSYQLFTWFMNSDNTLRESKAVTLSTNATGEAFAVPNAFEIKRVEDFNGDGKADILFRNADAGSIVIWKMDSNVVDMNFGSTFSNINLRTFSVIGTGDFDNNGVRDILFRSGGTMVTWLLQTTNSQFSLITPPDGQTNSSAQSGFVKYQGTAITQLTPEWEVFGLGDFDKTFTTNPNLADNRDDILFLNRLTGQVVVWLMNGSEIEDGGFLASGAVISGNPGNFNFVGLGDSNNDGNLDMLWRSKAGSDLVLWQMNGTDIDLSGSGYLRVNNQNVNALSPNLQIVTRNNLPGGRRLVDFNADKRSDILFRDTTTGQLILWGMDGRTVDLPNSGLVKNIDGSIPAVPASAFQVIGGLTSDLKRVAQSTAGSDYSTAFNVGVLNGSANYQDSVNKLGNGDFYKFKLEKPSDITLQLVTGLNATALASATFKIVKDDLAKTAVTLTTAQLTQKATITLDPGSYFVQVTSTNSGAALTNVPYNLVVTGEPNVVNFKALSLASVTATTAAFQGQNGAIRLADLGDGITFQTPDSQKPKAKVDIAYTLTNTEQKTSGPVDVSFYLSRTSVIDVTNTQNTKFLGKQTVSSVPGNSQVLNQVFQVDLPPGDNNIWTTDTNYFIGYRIDDPDLIQETFEAANPGQTDNISVIKTVAIENTQTPDLRGASLTTASPSITRGSTITLNYRVENIGKRATGSLPGGDNLLVRFYLYRPSTDPNLTPAQQNALVIGDSTRTVALTSPNDGQDVLPLDIPGGTTTPQQSITLSLPGANAPIWQGATAGTPFFIAMVTESGDVIAESIEGDALGTPPGNNYNLGLGTDRVALTLSA